MRGFAEGAEHAPRPAGHAALLRPAPAAPVPRGAGHGRRDDRGRARPSISTTSRRSTPAGRSATSATCIPAALRRDRGPRPVPDPADARRRARRDGAGAADAMSATRPPTPAPRAPDPGLAPRPADPADLRRPDDDGPRRPAAVEPRLGRLRRRVRHGQHDARAPQGPQPSRPTRSVSLLVVDPDNTEPLHPGPRRRRARHRRGARAPRRAHPRSTPATRRTTATSTRSGSRRRETRVICRIHARRITLDAIHA